MSGELFDAIRGGHNHALQEALGRTRLDEAGAAPPENQLFRRDWMHSLPPSRAWLARRLLTENGNPSLAWQRTTQWLARVLFVVVVLALLKATDGNLLLSPLMAWMAWLIGSGLMFHTPVAAILAAQSRYQFNILPADDARITALAPLEALFAKLEPLRATTWQQGLPRILRGIALGAAAGVALALVFQGPWKFMLLVAAMFAFMGFGVAEQRASKAYTQFYRKEIVPRLMSVYRPLRWQEANPPLKDLRLYALLPSWNITENFYKAEAANEFCGEHDGVPLSIMDLKLILPPIGKGSDRTCFEGLLITLTLPRRMDGALLIAPSGASEIPLKLRGRTPEKVKLENHPDFSAAYRVYASDQTTAHTLLTPAFIERWMKLRQDAGPDQTQLREQMEPTIVDENVPVLGRALPVPSKYQGGMMKFLLWAGAEYALEPVALVCDSRMFVTLPIPSNYNPFTYAPSYRHSLTDREMLTHLHERVVAIFQVVDEMVDLVQSWNQRH